MIGRTSDGTEFVFDDEFADIVLRHKWFIRTDACGNKYVHTNVRMSGTDGPRTILKLHRLVMNAKPNQEIDHKDGNGLNNALSNLRFASHAENMRNRRKHAVRTSPFKGVGWHSGARKWMARIAVNGATKYLGLFSSEKDAAKAYDEAATVHHGTFACPNGGTK